MSAVLGGRAPCPTLPSALPLPRTCPCLAPAPAPWAEGAGGAPGEGSAGPARDRRPHLGAVRGQCPRSRGLSVGHAQRVVPVGGDFCLKSKPTPSEGPGAPPAREAGQRDRPLQPRLWGRRDAGAAQLSQGEKVLEGSPALLVRQQQGGGRAPTSSALRSRGLRVRARAQSGRGARSALITPHPPPAGTPRWGVARSRLGRPLTCCCPSELNGGFNHSPSGAALPLCHLHGPAAGGEKGSRGA